MPTVHYVLRDGTTETVDAHEGETIQSLALSTNIKGIIAACGGLCSCGTCHVYVDQAWLASFPEPAEDELAVLEGVAAERLPNSRLGCQLTLTAAHDGLIVTMPETQE